MGNGPYMDRFNGGAVFAVRKSSRILRIHPSDQKQSFPPPWRPDMAALGSMKTASSLDSGKS